MIYCHCSIWEHASESDSDQPAQLLGQVCLIIKQEQLAVFRQWAYKASRSSYGLKESVRKTLENDLLSIKKNSGTEWR